MTVHHKAHDVGQSLQLPGTTLCQFEFQAQGIVLSCKRVNAAALNNS
jgi:hypothetical protein